MNLHTDMSLDATTCTICRAFYGQDAHHAPTICDECADGRTHVHRAERPDQRGRVTGTTTRDDEPYAYVMWSSGINAGYQTMIAVTKLVPAHATNNA